MDRQATAWEGIDQGRREKLLRALNVSGAGSVYLQTFINRTVQDLSNRDPGLWTTLDHRPGTGDAAYVNKRTPGTTGGSWVADTGTATEETGAPSQTSFTFRTAITQAKITRKLSATGRSYADVMSLELNAKVPDFVNFLEEMLANGDNAADANQPSGLITLIQGTAGQIVANTSAAAGDSFSLAKLDEAIDAVRGANNRKAIFCSRTGSRALNAALQAQQQFVNMVEIRAGFRVKAYDDIPIVKSTSIGDDYTWNGTKVTALSGEASNPTTAFVVVNLDEVWIEELTSMSVLPLARVSSQYEEVDIFADLVTVLANTYGGAVLGGIVV